MNFKLGVTSSETITLTSFYRDSVVLLSSITYNMHGSGESFGRVVDGHSDIVLFDECMDADGNKIFTSTPLEPNGSKACETVSDRMTLAKDSVFQIYTRGKTIVLQNIDRGCLVEVFSVSGILITQKTAQSDVVEISLSVPGIYFIKVGSDIRKVVVER